MEIAHVYIDGFNLYYGVLRKSPHKWLNLGAWADRLLPSYDVRRIVYCTARVQASAADPSVHVRQDAYLRALATDPRVEVLEGQFKQNRVRMPRVPLDTCDCCMNARQSCACCHGSLTSVMKTEEKGSDVNLAVQVLRDAYRGSCDAALIVSGDSDIQPSIDIVSGELHKKVIVADPRNRKHRPLRGDESREVRTAGLAACQFPNIVIDHGGRQIHRPAGW